MAALNKSHEPVSPLVMPGGFDHSYSTEDVRAQVARIMISGEFNRSPRLRRFLQFIIDESLSGREGQIKAYTIGLAVCDRDEQFDPSIDPIVRIEAGRLRRALEHYYLTQGANDPIAIDVPKGAYRPVISSRPELHDSDFHDPENSSPSLPPRVLQRLSSEISTEATPAVASMPATPSASEMSFLRRMAAETKPAWFVAALAVMSFSVAVSFMDKAPSQDQAGIRIQAPNLSNEFALWRMPTLLVLPFHSDGSDSGQASVADAVTEGVARNLMQQADLNVRRASNGNSGTVAGLYDSPSIDFVVSGSVRKVDNHLRIFVQLTNVAAQASVWSQNYDREIQSDAVDSQDDIARAIMTQVAKFSMRTTPVSR